MNERKIVDVWLRYLKVPISVGRNRQIVGTLWAGMQDWFFVGLG